MSYKRLTPCIFIDKGKAVTWFDDRSVLSDDVIALAKHYNEKGADELIVFNLSDVCIAAGTILWAAGNLFSYRKK